MYAVKPVCSDGKCVFYIWASFWGLWFSLFNYLSLFWLSHREEMHLKILKAFVGLHEFSDLNLVQALRFVKGSLECCSSFTFSLAFVLIMKPSSFLPARVCCFSFSSTFAGSFCGAFVSQEKLKRLTGWWRRLQLATVAVTPGSSNPQVQAQKGWFIFPHTPIKTHIFASVITKFYTRLIIC